MIYQFVGQSVSFSVGPLVNIEKGSFQSNSTTRGYFFSLGASHLVVAALLWNFPQPNEKKITSGTLGMEQVRLVIDFNHLLNCLAASVGSIVVVERKCT